MSRTRHAARQAADSHSRSALLAATGQQAREQLQKADAALAVLTDPATAITPGERAARAADARRAVARISMLLTDLRDLRRLQAGALDTYLRAVDLDEVLAAALEDLGPGGPPVTLSLPEDLPDVIADAALLTRILTSLIAEALHRSPPGHPPALTAASHEGHAEIRITDHGPPQAEGSEPDALGFRLARDLTEAMGDTLRCERGADCGRTVVITLPAAANPPLTATTDPLAASAPARGRPTARHRMTGCVGSLAEPFPAATAPAPDPRDTDDHDAVRPALAVAAGRRACRLLAPNRIAGSVRASNYGATTETKRTRKK